MIFIFEYLDESLNIELHVLLIDSYPEFVRELYSFQMILDGKKTTNKIVGNLNVRHKSKIDLAFTIQNSSSEWMKGFSISSNVSIIFNSVSNLVYYHKQKLLLIFCVQGNIVPTYESCARVSIKIITN